MAQSPQQLLFSIIAGFVIMTLFINSVTAPAGEPPPFVIPGVAVQADADLLPFISNVTVSPSQYVYYDYDGGLGNDDEFDPFNGTYYTIKVPDEQRLLSMLMAQYSRDNRPVVNPTSPIVVNIGLNLIQIFDLDEKNSVLVANCWIDQEWNDELIRWNPSEYGGLEIIRIPSNLLWQPDILLYNNADEYKSNKVISRAMVAHDGNVFLPLPAKIFSSCQIDVTFFPFDEQLCSLKYGSWTYDGNRLDMSNRTEGVDLTNYIQNGEWDVIGTYQHRNLVYYSCCAEPYSDVTFYIHLRRKALYYVMNVFVPSTTMTAMTLFAFLLPSDSNQKVNLGITTFLSYSVFTLSVVEKLPETSEYMSLINLYLAGVLSSTSLSVLNTVMVLSIFHRSASKLKPIPPRLRKIFFTKIGRAICLHEPKPFSAPTSLLTMAENLKGALLSSKSPSTVMTPEKLLSVPRKSKTAIATEAFLRGKKKWSVRRRISTRRRRQRGGSISSASSISSSSGDESRDSDSSSKSSINNLLAMVAGDLSLSSELRLAAVNSQLNSASNGGSFLLGQNVNFADLKENDVDEIVKSLAKVARVHRREQQNEQIMIEWRHLALIVDRILFIIFLTFTISTIVFLTVGPRHLQPDLSPHFAATVSSSRH